jgi:hypothetical protein
VLHLLVYGTFYSSSKEKGKALPLLLCRIVSGHSDTLEGVYQGYLQEL